MKKIINLIIVLLLSLSVCLISTSCGGNSNSKETEYKIDYVLNGGVCDNPSTYKSSSATFTLNNPTKAGFKFIGWSIGSEEPNLNVTIKTGSTGDLKFIANYEEAYTITYNLNGGKASNPTQYSSSDSFTLNNPTLDGKSFIGWTYDGQSVPRLNAKVEKGTTGNLTFTANFEDYTFEPLTIAVFADIQLRSEADKNQGLTTNAHLALINHFKYCKYIDADVIVMDGDIVNNAVDSYYETFRSAFVEVYGANPDLYPEFVMNMGNHEWWDKSEKDIPQAVSLFKKYARIDSPYLVKESSVTYGLDGTTTLPSYYKVIKGVPFLVISGENSSGYIGYTLKEEISSWLEEISQLESVKNGGPIYVSYHYPVPGVTFKGEHTNDINKTVNELLKNYPNVVLFTGDTHFNAVNERTINQIDYTSINLGSSSYSRSISESATGFQFNNVNVGNGKSSAGTMLGDLNFKYEYTPTISVITMDEQEKTLIDRYYTEANYRKAKHIGITWELGLIKSKEQFIYTDDRIQNTDWAMKLYGKSGLDWDTDETVRFNVEGNKMFIAFNDVIDYNACEHYRIEIEDPNDKSMFKYYDFMGHYYKYDDEAHSYHFVLENLFVANNYSVKVTAYDFFDNPSLNVLSSSVDDDSLEFPEEVDLKLSDTYCDISNRVNYDITHGDSISSIEYYYKGLTKYPYAILLGDIYIQDSKDLSAYMTSDNIASGKLEFYVKNMNNYDLNFTLCYVTKDSSGNETWIDGEMRIKQVVSANSDWTKVEWDFSLSPFAVPGNSLYQLRLKVGIPNEVIDVKKGYEVSFLIDDIDII